MKGGFKKETGSMDRRSGEGTGMGWVSGGTAQVHGLRGADPGGEVSAHGGKRQRGVPVPPMRPGEDGSNGGLCLAASRRRQVDGFGLWLFLF